MPAAFFAVAGWEKDTEKARHNSPCLYANWAACASKRHLSWEWISEVMCLVRQETQYGATLRSLGMHRRNLPAQPVGFPAPPSRGLVRVRGSESSAEVRCYSRNRVGTELHCWQLHRHGPNRTVVVVGLLGEVLPGRAGRTENPDVRDGQSVWPEGRVSTLEVAHGFEFLPAEQVAQGSRFTVLLAARLVFAHRLSAAKVRGASGRIDLSLRCRGGNMHDASIIASGYVDGIKLLTEIFAAVGMITTVAASGIAWVFGHWATKMTQEFAAAALGVFSALLVAAFVELFISLRKSAEDKSRIEKLHASALSRSIAAFNFRRTSDPYDRLNVREYFSRSASLRSRHKLHVLLWAALSAMLVVLIGLLLQWSSLDSPTGGAWNRYLPGAAKVVYVLSIIYFVTVSVMRINLERRILKWERRAKLAEYFRVPDTDQVFELEKRWKWQIRRGLNEEVDSGESTVRAAPDRARAQRSDPAPHARPQEHIDPETRAQPRDATAAPGQRSRAHTQGRLPTPGESRTQNQEQ